mgnify:CR=1 FL=1
MANNVLQLGDAKEIILEFSQNLPPELISSFGTLITILKTLGVIFIIYILFLIVDIIMNIRRNLMIKRMYEKVNDIDNKLNKLIKKKK